MRRPAPTGWKVTGGGSLTGRGCGDAAESAAYDTAGTVGQGDPGRAGDRRCTRRTPGRYEMTRSRPSYDGRRSPSTA